MHSVSYPSLQYHKDSFTILKNSLYFICSTTSPLTKKRLETTGLFFVSVVVFSRISYKWNHIVCSIFRLASFA